MSTILHFNRNEEFLGKLSNILETHHVEEINGENYLTLSTYSAIGKKDRLLYKNRDDIWHEFIVSNVEEFRDPENPRLIRNVYAENSIYETLGDYIDDAESTTTAMNALTVALGPSRWSAGIVEPTNNDNIHFYHTSVMTAIMEIVDLWDVEVRFRIVINGNTITHRYVDLLNRRGETIRRRFVYNKNLESIRKTVNDDNVYTALYGYGKGEEIISGFKKYTRRLDFASINGGKAYVENIDARNSWGRVQNGSKVHVFGKIEFDDIENKSELLTLTQEKLAEVSKPSITYEATIVDLSVFDERFANLELGDTIQIIDKEFTPELRLESRIIRIERDLKTPAESIILLGNFIPTLTNIYIEQEKVINVVRSNYDIWNKADEITGVETDLSDLEVRVKALEDKIKD